MQVVLAGSMYFISVLHINVVSRRNYEGRSYDNPGAVVPE